jgi:hypothetical protein
MLWKSSSVSVGDLKLVRPRGILGYVDTKAKPEFVLPQIEFTQDPKSFLRRHTLIYSLLLMVYLTTPPVGQNVPSSRGVISA